MTTIGGVDAATNVEESPERAFDARPKANVFKDGI
jgi:hypothetical protein